MAQPARTAPRLLLLAGLLTLAACGKAPQPQTPPSADATNIAMVQGVTSSGDSPSPLLNQTVTVEGVVTGLRTSYVSSTRTTAVDGFFLQEETRDADGNPLTSDGIFVFCGTDCPAVEQGDIVRVTGKVTEQFTATQITAASEGIVKVQSGAAPPAAVRLELPLPVESRERYEGMRVGVSGVVTNNFTLGRGASFDIADDRIFTYTQINRPSAEGLAAYEQQVAQRTLRIDDSSRWQNPDPVVFARNGQPLSAENTLRGGDRVTVIGVMTFGNDGWNGSGSEDVYRLYARSARITGPARPETPENVGGTLRVGSMNVLNYFTTLDGDNTGCTTAGSSADARGANNCAEFVRQRDKIVAAITKLDADVLGLLEIQNDFDKGAASSIANLVTALNTATAPGTYAAINPGENVGTDAITVAMIYKPGNVTPVGQLAVLDDRFDPTYRADRNRPTLAHTFQSKANGGRVTAVVAHLKSKGSACTGDADLGDGQGNCNQTRTNAARLIAQWLKTNPTGVEEADHLVLGDLNAYSMEDPLRAFEEAGYVNLFTSSSYSYQFDGQWGSLDHALASGSLKTQVTGQTKWHINADEPTVLDYNTEFKSAAQIDAFYAPDAFRSSDHDPVLVGLNLSAQTPLPPSAPVVRVNLSPATANLTVTSGGEAVTQSFTTTGFNAPEQLTVTITPQNGAPALATAPSTVATGEGFNVRVSAPVGTVTGTYTYEVKVSADGVNDMSLLTVTVQAPAVGPAFGNLVISQVYGGGGNSGAPLRSDFVEVFNRGKVPVTTTGLSLQYASNAGAFSAVNTFALPTATIAPGAYYLIKLADGSNTSAAALPTPNATGALGLSGTGGKIALVNNTDPITAAADADVIDFVGFGTSANEREGASNTPAPSNTTSIFRKLNGCQDTNQNGTDFVTGAPAPRNSATPLNVCN